MPWSDIAIFCFFPFVLTVMLAFGGWLRRELDRKVDREVCDLKHKFLNQRISKDS